MTHGGKPPLIGASAPRSDSLPPKVLFDGDRTYARRTLVVVTAHHERVTLAIEAEAARDMALPAYSAIGFDPICAVIGAAFKHALKPAVWQIDR